MEEISDEKFKADVTRFIEVATERFDGLVSDNRTNSYKLDRFEALFASMNGKFDRLEGKVDLIYGQFSDVASKVVGIEKRLQVVEAKLNLMEIKMTSLEEETRQIRLELNDFNEWAGQALDTRERLDQLGVRVFQLEEKVAG